MSDTYRMLHPDTAAYERHELTKAFSAAVVGAITETKVNPDGLVRQLARAICGAMKYDGCPEGCGRCRDMLAAARAACVALNGQERQRCEHCGKGFITGTGTGRRSSSKYCSKACKIAAFRARELRKELRG